MEAFLSAWLPRFLPSKVTFAIHAHRGKPDLMRKLESRLRAYAAWLPTNYRVVVVVDRDDNDCNDVKKEMEDKCEIAGMGTRRTVGIGWRCATCLAIEELEGWYFGDWEAVCAAYPGVSQNTSNNARYRNPDEIAGGTWEAFERVMQRAGFFQGGLEKVAAARAIGKCIDVNRSRSSSFCYLAGVLSEAIR